MAQSSLLGNYDIRQRQVRQFSVFVVRVVNLNNYESLHVGLAEVLNLAATIVR
jgi:hypothetical protein